MIAPPHTIIYTHGGGRLGNQLIRFAHWMAWARRHDGQVEVLDLAFWPYANLFDLWRGHPGSVFPVRPSRADRFARWRAALPDWLRRRIDGRDRLARVVQAAGRLRPGWQSVTSAAGKSGTIDLGDAAFLAQVTRSRVTLCSGWRISSWQLFEEQQAELRKVFQPAPEFAHRAKEFMAPLRANHDVVAGLMIRQSDYRSWADGRFFFPTTRYVTWIRQLLDLYPGRRLAVVVASEEWQDPALFVGLPCHFTTGSLNRGGHWFESFAELALCDFVLSAPSTFGASAAFVGGIPLWPLSASDQSLAFDQLLEDGLADAARHPVFSCAVK